jgi:Flp/Fap pilin component.
MLRLRGIYPMLSNFLKHHLKNYLNKLRRLQRARVNSDEEGQAITEYGAILAFVAVLIALVFAFGGSGIGPAISNAFSSITQQLNDMSATAGGASGS